MFLHKPTTLLKVDYKLSFSAMFRENVGWDRQLAIMPLLSDSSSEVVLDDVFTQKGKGKRNACYHCKLPYSYTLVSQSSLEYWQQLNAFDVSYKLTHEEVETKMVNSTSSGISMAFMLLIFPTIDGFICGYAMPTRGIRSNYWTIGSITYLAYRLFKPVGRYNYERSVTVITVSDHKPWISNASYDPEYVRSQIISNFKPETFRYSKLKGNFTPYSEYSEPNFYENLFKEDMRINGLNVLGNKNVYEFDWLVQHAFYDACQGIGKANENMLANVVDFVTFIASVCSTLGIASLSEADDIVEHSTKSLTRRAKEKLNTKLSKVNNFSSSIIADHLDDDLNYIEETQNVVVSSFNGTVYNPVRSAETGADAWLGYRYGYCTTAADYRQYVHYVCHVTDMWWRFFQKNYHAITYGTSHREVDGQAVLCRCELAYRPRTFNGLESVCRYVHDAGMEINPYVLWDLIPFSFVVDWKWPLGDVFQVLSDKKFYSETYYDFEFVGFSTKYNMGDKGTRYYRWYQGPPDLESFYWFDEGDDVPSGKLIMKRALDAVSLIVKL